MISEAENLGVSVSPRCQHGYDDTTERACVSVSRKARSRPRREDNNNYCLLPPCAAMPAAACVLLAGGVCDS